MLGQKNTKKQGDVGLGAAIGWYTENEYTVSIPLTDSQDYDLVVGEFGKMLRKVQVRTTRYLGKGGNGAFEASLTMKGGNQSWGGVIKKLTECEDIDDFFILTGDGKKYLIPRLDIVGRSTIRLGGPKALAEDYLV